MNFKGCPFRIPLNECFPIGFAKSKAKSSNEIRCWKNSNVYSALVSNVGVLIRRAKSLSNAFLRIFVRDCILLDLTDGIDGIHDSAPPPEFMSTCNRDDGSDGCGSCISTSKLSSAPTKRVVLFSFCGGDVDDCCRMIPF